MMQPMTGAVRAFRSLLAEEDGASASEYAVLTAVVVVTVAAALSVFDLNVFFGIKAKVLACVGATDGSC